MDKESNTINNGNNEGEKNYSLVNTKIGDDFKTELQKSIDQYKYEFEKRLYNVLNKNIFNSPYDPTKNIFDTNGNFISHSEKNSNRNQKQKRKSQNNINNLLKKNNSFIYSTSSYNLDFGNRDFNTLNNNNNKWKFKSENNIADLRRRNANNQTQYLSNKPKASSYNNISYNNNKLSSSGNNLYDVSEKKSIKNKKDYQIRKTFEDLQKELNNLENDFKENNNKLNDEKIIDMRKKELHKNYKEYIKLNVNIDTPNMRRYKNYVNDYEWAKQRHLDSINKQNTPKTTTEIDEITKRLYNPDNYPNVYKVKYNNGKSTEKLDSNLNKKISSSKKKLNGSSKEKIYSKSEPSLNSTDDYARARMIDQINNFSPLSPENFTMKSSKTKKPVSNSLNTLNLNSNTNNINTSTNIKSNNNININKNKSNDNIKKSTDIKKSNININNNDKMTYNTNNSQNNISKNKISNSQRDISNSNNKINKVSFSNEDTHRKSTRSNNNLKSNVSLNKSSSYINSESSNRIFNSKSSNSELSNSMNNLKKKNINKSKSKSISSSLNHLESKSKRNSKLNKSFDSISQSTRKNKYSYKENTEEITEKNDINYESDDSFEIENEDTGEQAALQFQHIMSVSSKSINNLTNYD
ncbi:hypothetical protein BCR32DRAFT_264027 [Anaeromyces robustus]|uniref:Uncharacterized protein n=1 Tax=Anaeromyces robustus TaxID=1754192 RepID=A0A1Y1XPY2_9FUNG|nr:hypothetical protein BCR32DRAFT_264027 [Anaeromyces robustus]|eukprot:ORX87791.1 hypothetical protein BCR32DRAFT_264027 [Anaeromyces robustus]